MPELAWMLPCIAVLTTLLAFAWLALAMDAHWRQVHGGAVLTPGVRVTLRVLGGAGLIASAVLCFIADRPSMAVLVWLMQLAGAVPLVGLALAWRPRLLRAAWPWSGR
ncbi:MAG: DUF3325 domain-containing protein [Moraxellaceae bacterium]|nr:DUF3325 domain-containing protein [Moraxellaceae bacterium]